MSDATAPRRNVDDFDRVRKALLPRVVEYYSQYLGDAATVNGKLAVWHGCPRCDSTGDSESFKVKVPTGQWFCHRDGCENGGDVFSFLTDYRMVATKGEALRTVARFAGVEIEPATAPGSGDEPPPPGEFTAPPNGRVPDSMPASDGGELDLLGIATSGQQPGPVPHLFRDSDGEGPIQDGDIIVLAADGEGGKSTLALGMSMSFATGTNFAGRFSVTESLPVLYYDGENNERLITRRWLRLLNGSPDAKQSVLGWEESRFRYRWRGTLTVDTEAGRDLIVARCQEYGSKVLVLDTQIRFTAGDLTVAQDAAALYGHLSEIKRRGELRLIIMLAHLRKRAPKGGVNDLGQRLYGSVDLRNSCDCLIVLVKPPGAGVTVVHEKTRWDNHYPNFAVELVEDGEDAAKLVAGDAVNSPPNTVRFLVEESECDGMLRKDLDAEVGNAHPDMKPEAVRKAVGRELKSRSYASKPEGRSARYWLRMYAPEDAA